jgi:hypothetical protein
MRIPIAVQLGLLVLLTAVLGVAVLAIATVLCYAPPEIGNGQLTSVVVYHL